ncbi:g6f-like [Aplochiton taeniatus]
MKLVFQYDRWRGSSQQAKAQLHLAGPPYEPKAGDFSFLLAPGIKDGGLYICEVFLNDNVFSQRTLLSVLQVRASRSPSALVLWCQYSELSQVKRAGWTFQNQSRKLALSAPYPGSITVSLPLPHNQDAVGNYTCTLQMNNGQTVRGVYTVTLPLKESISVATPSLPLLPSISALLLLVLLVAAVAGVLLWRQGHISRRGIEQSLSHYSGEVENIYENPEDLRQTSPQGSVYMDLKPTGEEDVYKELDR